MLATFLTVCTSLRSGYDIAGASEARPNNIEETHFISPVIPDLDISADGGMCLAGDI
jgi:hypothetical protein